MFWHEIQTDRKNHADDAHDDKTMIMTMMMMMMIKKLFMVMILIMIMMMMVMGMEKEMVNDGDADDADDDHSFIHSSQRDPCATTARAALNAGIRRHSSVGSQVHR